MTTYDLLFEPTAEADTRTGILAWFRRTWKSFRRRREERATVIALSRLDEHLLRDIGIEPMDIQDALTGRRQLVLFNPMRNKDK